ncbi:pilus assembly protein HicB [Ammoniphilus oxalaticus]|uniref:Pilus assembly protein HicB n=1 Tax=Ammoniphilus oxalaticus TaxID=66863 RepID=A0A419SKK2_9BACL|nr:type II toxin-antitoxin system HicB family antitoxin [Ammoniphilus oxalaticus]RKD24544.1 pilus assembly protein HicB [Ammoniphilus oxalaticus]
MSDRYIYPAIFDYAEDGISIEFPDLPGCYTCGNTEEEALRMAKEAMALHLYGLEQDKDMIPQPSKVKSISVGHNQVVVLVEAWMPPFRHEIENKSVKKTLTIPKWLDNLAQENNVNFSYVLQDALKIYLGVRDKSS